jgi:membrane peptidoglycan carboxypeptidase
VIGQVLAVLPVEERADRGGEAEHHRTGREQEGEESQDETVHAADGSLLAEYAHERRLYLPIQAMPKIVVAAFLSAEDKNLPRAGSSWPPAG